MAITGIWDDEKQAYVTPAEKFGYRFEHRLENQVARTDEELKQWTLDELWDEVDVDRFIDEALEWDHLEGGWYLDPEAEPWDYVVSDDEDEARRD